MIKIGSKWREVVTRAWSMRLMAAAAVFSAVEIGLPLLDMWHPFPPLLFAVLSMFSTAAAIVARITVQRDLPHG